MSAAQAFSPKTVFWGIAASVIAFAGFLLLATYAPDFREMPRGAATAKSKAGNGYAGIVKLLELAGEDVYLTSEPSEEYTLLVVPIDIRTDPDRLSELAREREGMETLFVLPKWWVGNDRESTTKVVRYHRMNQTELKALIEAIDAKLTDFDAEQGAADAIETADEQHFVLTNADLLNNAGLATPEGASKAVELVRKLKTRQDDEIAFDISLTRAEKTQSLAKLAFEPPFLALTLALLAAAILAFVGGLGRFGPPRRAARAMEFGKRALADATARLMRRGKRIGGLGDRYASVLRNRAAILLQAPATLKGEKLDAWLDAHGAPGEAEFTTRLDALRRSDNERALLASADQLHRWIEGKHLGH